VYHPMAQREETHPIPAEETERPGRTHLETIPNWGGLIAVYLFACWRGSADRRGSNQKKPGSQPPVWNGLLFFDFLYFA